MKIIFATGNTNKLKEVQALMPDTFEIVSLKDMGFDGDIEETGATIEANSLLKAQTIFDKYQLPVFAEDTGLEIDALNGEPGVFSARYAGEPSNAEKNMELVLEKLHNQEKRSAHFKTVATFLDGTTSIIETGIVKGQILTSRTGNDGFGYDPIFRPEGFKLSFAEMDHTTKNLISHRGIAIRRLIHKLKTDYS